MPYSACQQASQDLFDDAVRLERIFLRYEPKVVSSDSCTYTGLVQEQIATQLLGQQLSESTPMVVRGDGNCLFSMPSPWYYLAMRMLHLRSDWRHSLNYLTMQLSMSVYMSNLSYRTLVHLLQVPFDKVHRLVAIHAHGPCMLPVLLLASLSNLCILSSMALLTWTSRSWTPHSSAVGQDPDMISLLCGPVVTP
jgi:hypothetical protein